MARIDSLLAIVNQQAANELRMGTDREPKMLAQGAAKTNGYIKGVIKLT